MADHPLMRRFPALRDQPDGVVLHHVGDGPPHVHTPRGVYVIGCVPSRRGSGVASTPAVTLAAEIEFA